MSNNICVILIVVANELLFLQISFAQGNANKKLSNLTSPTAVNVDLLPNATNLRNLGSSALRWKDIQANGSIFLGGVRFLTATTGTGSFNTAVGASVLNSNTDGESNTGAGYQALFSNTQGWNNTAIGYQALYNSNADYNTAIGGSALFSNTSGYENTAVGSFALFSNTTGYLNTASGGSALSQNTTGHSSSAYGWAALTYNTTGYSNSAFGYAALFKNTTGGENAAFGSFALYGNTSSWGNTAIGVRAGDSYANGYYNTYLGSDADANAAGYYNSVAIGNISTVTGSLMIRVGNSLIGSIGGYQNWSNISDGRYKKNVKEDVKGLEFIMKLRPVTYHLDVAGISNHLNESRGHESDQQMKDAIAAKEKVVFSGFIAQDVEKAAKKTGYDFSGVDAPENENDLYRLRYAEFVVPLVKAVQELDKVNHELKTQNEELIKQNEKLTQRMETIESLVEINDKVFLSFNSPLPSLEQNSPNPFNASTTIHFYIPVSTSSAELKIWSSDGKEIKSFSVAPTGPGQIEINGSTLSPGVYTYTLFIDGKPVGSHQMIMTK